MRPIEVLRASPIRLFLRKRPNNAMANAAEATQRGDTILREVPPEAASC